MAFDPPLTQRERWQRCFHYQSIDRVPNYEFGYWDELYARWHAQGLPESITTEREADRYFGYDERMTFGIRTDVIPSFPYEELENDGTHITYIDANGVTAVKNASGESTIPHFIDFPIKDRATWEEYKHRLDPDNPARQHTEEELAAFEKRARESTVPVGISCGSLFGRVRDRTGFAELAMLCYDDPDLVHEMVETQCQMIINTMTPLLERIQFDYAGGWEDIAFNNGPMISPDMAREFLLPRYKRIGDLLNRHGVDVIWTDCDGNINDLIPIWMESGYKCMFPIEVRAGSDPVAMREKYGKDILLLGGFDKMKFMEGKAEILEELKRLEPYVEQGGFVPHVDHRVQADAPLENYKYYVREKRALLGYPASELDDWGTEIP